MTPTNLVTICALRKAARVFLLPAAMAVSSGCSQFGAGVEQTSGPVLYPLPPASPRIAYLTSISDSGIFEHRSPSLERFLFGHESETAQRITKPFGLAAGHDTLLVCDTRQNLVHVFDFKAQRCGTLGTSGRGRLLKPVAVAMDNQANRYVADTLRKEVVVFSAEGEAIRALNHSNGDPFKPVAVAWHEGTLFVLNGAMHRVEVLDPMTGKVLDSFGEQGSGPGQMLWPTGMALDSKGQAYVSDLLNCRVQVFDSDHHALLSFGQAGDRAGNFSRPKHLCVGPDGIVYVVDAGFQRVQMFDEQGRVLMLFGGPGSDPGSLTLPAGICLDQTLLPYFSEHLPEGFQAQYLLFVSDQFGERKVNVYAFGHMAS